MVRPCSSPGQQLKLDRGAEDNQHAMSQTPEFFGTAVGIGKFVAVTRERDGMRAVGPVASAAIQSADRRLSKLKNSRIGVGDRNGPSTLARRGSRI